jgi:hypothetical protein
MPTRRASAAEVNAREARWVRDMAAYKALRKDGLQPPKIDGAAALQRDAKIPEHVTTGMTHIKPRAFEAFAETFGHSATEPAITPAT